MKKNRKIKAVILPAFAAILCVVLFFFVGERLPLIYADETVLTLTDVTYETETGEGVLILPTTLKNLPPRTAVTLYAEILSEQGGSLYVKSVFAKTKLYINGVEFVYEFGQDGSHPAFMNDPPTGAAVVPLPQSGETISIRLEYISPSQRSELSIPVMYVGDEGAIIAMLFRSYGFSLLFSLMLIFIGTVMGIIFLVFVRKMEGGVSFLWLGFFSLSAGIWILGECDLSVFLIPYPSLLYAMAYLGLFCFTIPFLHFGLVILKPKNKLPILAMLTVHYFAVAAALLLQFTGTVDLMKTLYTFHVITPLGFVVFAAVLLWEYFRYRNMEAKRFALAVIMLAAAVVLELVNYWFKLVGTFTVVFQFGVFCFIIALGIESGRYMREAMGAAAEKLRLEYEINAAQTRERHLAAENAMLDSLSRMKSDYLANISHEMRTPLTIMSGHAQQTEEEIEAGEISAQSIKNLRVIQSEAQRLGKLAGQVLYSAKNLQAGISIVPTRPSEILEHAAAVCAPILAKNGNRLETACEPDCPDAAANFDIIVQVLVNLCANAGRHTKKGVVAVTVKPVGNAIEFAVQDNGSGIAPELLPHVFERGVSGDDATGLGLVICKDVIRQHGGTIDIYSELGQGTTVVFTLPLSGKGGQA